MPEQLPAGFHRLYFSLLLASLVSAMDITIVATALPTVVAELGAVERIAWVVTAYSLALTFAIPIYGKLADRTSPRSLFLSALGIFIAGSIACGFSQSIVQLALARMCQGFGGAGLNLLALTVLSRALPERLRPKYLGPMGAVWGIATITGPVVGGVLTDGPGWRWIFWINIPLGLLALWFAMQTIPHWEGAEVRRRFDVLGAVLLALTTTSIVVGLSSAGHWFEWLSWRALGLVAWILLLLGLFVRQELRAEDPMLPIRLLRKRAASTSIAMTVLSGTGLFGIIVYIPATAQMAYGTSATPAGLTLFPMVLGMAITSIIIGNVISKTGRYRPYPIAGAAIGLVAFMYATSIALSDSIWLIVLVLLVAGVGAGLSGQLSVILTQAVAPAEQIGGATSLVVIIREIGGSIGAAGFGALFANRLVGGLDGITLPSGVTSHNIGPSDLPNMTAAARLDVAHAYFGAMHPVFQASAFIFVLALILAVAIPTIALKTRAEVH